MTRPRSPTQPGVTALRTDGARLHLSGARRLYDRADASTGAERRRLLRQAAVVMRAVRRAEGRA